MTDCIFKANIHRGALIPVPEARGRVAVELSKFPKEVPVDVTVSLPGKKRTAKQNNWHWSVIVPAFEQLGYERFSQWYEESGESPKDSAHNVIKQMFLDPVVMDLPDGQKVQVWPSSKHLTVAQFSAMDEKAERYLNGLGIYLPAKEQE